MKYFCAEQGASMEKTSIVKGQHSYETLLRLLDKYVPFPPLCNPVFRFIEKYLLC